MSEEAVSKLAHAQQDSSSAADLPDVQSRARQQAGASLSDQLHPLPHGRGSERCSVTAGSHTGPEATPWVLSGRPSRAVIANLGIQDEINYYRPLARLPCIIVASVADAVISPAPKRFP